MAYRGRTRTCQESQDMQPDLHVYNYVEFSLYTWPIKLLLRHTIPHERMG